MGTLITSPIRLGTKDLGYCEDEWHLNNIKDKGIAMKIFQGEENEEREKKSWNERKAHVLRKGRKWEKRMGNDRKVVNHKT